MILIAHRGNIKGPDPKKENEPSYILKSLKAYNAEVDVWYIKGRFWLGHDSPEYPVSTTFFLNENLWCHAKNKNALVQLKMIGAHFFWHNTDDYTLTSKNFIWTYPGIYLTSESIAVLPEQTKYSKDELKRSKGICSDYIEKYGRLIA